MRMLGSLIALATAFATPAQAAGDAVVAVFGTGRSHEDDPHRAVRAALRMVSDLERLDADVQREHGVGLRVRVGIDTGEVVLGAVGAKLGGTHPEEDRVGEVDGEVGEDLVHLLGGLTPARPEVHGGGPRAGHSRIQLRLRAHLPHRPTARHPRLLGLSPPSRAAAE